MTAAVGDVGSLDGWWWPPGPRPPQPGEDDGEIRLGRLATLPLDPLLDHLTEAGEALAELPVARILDALGRAGERLLEDRLPDLVARVSREARLSQSMAERVVAGMARGWTRAALERLLTSELGDGAVLDDFVAQGERRIRAYGRGATLHIGSGTVPGVSATSVIRALLVKCPSVVKPGRGDVALTLAYLQALAEADVAVAAAAAALYWPGGAADWAPIEARLMTWARQVVVYGGDEAVARVRTVAPPSTEVMVHPNRTGVVIADAGASPDEVAECVSTFDQRGCVSPHVVLFLGDEGEAGVWADAVAGALDGVEERWPPGIPDPHVRSRVNQIRGSLELRRAAGDPVGVQYRGDRRWTVLQAPLQDVVPLGDRSLWVVDCPDPRALDRCLGTLGPVLQSVGVAVSAGRERVVEAALRAGASRAVPVSALAFPEADWLHDGRGPLRELIRWAETRD